jgi:hypothetical protein
VTCSFICAPSGKPVAKVPCNRVFNQTIADEFNPLQLPVPVSVARVRNWRDLMDGFQATGVSSYHRLWFGDESPLRVASFRQNLFLLGNQVGLLRAGTGRACGILNDGAYPHC